MPRLNIFWPKKNKLIFLLPSLYVISILGLFFAQKANIFFSIDPDAAYYANALAILTGYPIGHTDHPGTPYQLYLAVILLPLRMLKFFQHVEFLPFALKNITSIFLTYRIANALLVFAGIYFFLRAISKLTSSKLSVIAGFLGIISMSFFYSRILMISPEGLLIMLLGIWLWMGAGIIKREQANGCGIWILPVIAGVGMAVKLTFLPVVSATAILMFVYQSKVRMSERMMNLTTGLFLILSSFIAGTWMIRDKYKFFMDWVTGLVTHTDFHAQGPASLFSLSSFSNSFASLFQQDPYYFLALIIIPFLLFKGPIKNNFNLRKFLISVYLASFSSVIIFAKFPGAWYQIVNYILITFNLSFFVSRVPKKAERWVMFLLICLIGAVFYRQFMGFRQRIFEAGEMSAFISQYNDRNKITIWTYLPTKETALLFGDNFSHFYGNQLKEAYPKIIQMYGSPLRIYDLGGGYYDLRSYCWQNAFVQSEAIADFLKQYGSGDDLTVTSDKAENVYFVKRTGCMINPI